MLRKASSLALLLLPGVASAAGIVFSDLCPGAMRVVRSSADQKRVEVYCVGEATPRLVLTDCPAPAQITSRGNDKTIQCPGGGLPAIVRGR